MDDEKSYMELLNGLACQLYYKNEDFTDEKLKEQLYPDMPDDEFIQYRNQCANIIKSMAISNMDFNQLEAYLTSQVKRKGGITQEQAKIFSKFWTNHKAKIHASLVEHSSWNPVLKDFRWRTDVKSCTLDNNDVNVPVAIVNICIEDTVDAIQYPRTIQFEADKQILSDMLIGLKEIEEILNSYCQN